MRFSPMTLESSIPIEVKPQKRGNAPRLDVSPEDLDATLDDLAALRRAWG